MQKKIITLVMSLSLSGILYAKRFEFIDANFEDFLKRVSSQEQEQKEFTAYYSALTKKIQEADENKKKATFRYLYDVALNRLQEKHAQWYEEIKPLVCDPRFTLDEGMDDARKVVKFFLSRYGAFEEYLNLKKAVMSSARCSQIKK